MFSERGQTELGEVSMSDSGSTRLATRCVLRGDPKDRHDRNVPPSTHCTLNGSPGAGPLTTAAFREAGGS